MPRYSVTAVCHGAGYSVVALRRNNHTSTAGVATISLGLKCPGEVPQTEAFPGTHLSKKIAGRI